MRRCEQSTIDEETASHEIDAFRDNWLLEIWSNRQLSLETASSMIWEPNDHMLVPEVKTLTASHK